MPLSHGEVILVHSILGNGWADGTSLDSGERGWLPTNYCQVYDSEQIRTLLKAVSNFRDSIKCTSDEDHTIRVSQDYVRGLIAGVRHLLVNDTFSCRCSDNGLVGMALLIHS